MSSMKQVRTPLNPFLLSGYHSPDYFCDREEETEKLVSALRNGRNVTLVSPRRMGKTGLIRHAFHRMEQHKWGHCYLVDLYQTENLTDFVSKLAKVVIGTLDTKGERFLKIVATFFKSLRPVFSLDAFTGEPEVSIDLQPECTEQSLEEIFSYMEHSDQMCFVAFDEFQRVAEYDKGRSVEALLRSHIQHLTNVHFVFSGSQRHILENMFAAATRPFYQSTQMMSLGCIEEEAYYTFAASKMEQHGQQLDKDAFHNAYHRLFAHTWYLQMLLNRLYETEIRQIDKIGTDMVLKEIVAENEASFQTILRLITPAQRRLLKAVAKEGEVQEINGKSFLTRHGLGAASTVNSAAKSLVEKELLLESHGTYSVYDRFLALYLANGVD